MSHLVDAGPRAEPDDTAPPGDDGRMDRERPSGLERLGRFCGRRHWPVISVWVLVVLALGVASQAHHGATRDKFEIPGSQSQKAADLLASEFPAASGSSATVV